MFGLGKRKRELEEAAKSVAQNLLGEAIREDQHRRGAAFMSPSTSEDLGGICAAWVDSASIKWQMAKRGDPDALRQTARNYLFGAGMPVDPCKARLWLEAARLVQVGPLLEQPSVHPFWANMEEELNGILTAKERIRASEDAMHWVKKLRRAQRRSLR